VRAVVFPALGRPLERGAAAAPTLAAGDACCFYHDGKEASVICDDCGRFLCSLCSLPVAERSVCPGCFGAGTAYNVAHKENRRVLHDNIALMLTLPPLVFNWIGLFFSPAAIVYALWNWRKQNTLVPRSHVRFVLAIGIGLLELALAGAVVMGMFIG